MEHEFWPVIECVGQLFVLQYTALDELDPLLIWQIPLASRRKVIEHDDIACLEFEKSPNQIAANEASSTRNEYNLLLVSLGQSFWGRLRQRVWCQLAEHCPFPSLVGFSGYGDESSRGRSPSCVHLFRPFDCFPQSFFERCSGVVA